MSLLVDYQPYDLASNRIQKLSRDINGLVTLYNKVENENELNLSNSINLSGFSTSNLGNVNKYGCIDFGEDVKFPSAYYSHINAGSNLELINSGYTNHLAGHVVLTRSYYEHGAILSTNVQCSACFTGSNLPGNTQYNSYYAGNQLTTTPLYYSGTFNLGSEATVASITSCADKGVFSPYYNSDFSRSTAPPSRSEYLLVDNIHSDIYCFYCSELKAEIRISKNYSENFEAYFAQLITNSGNSKEKKLESISQKIKRIKKLISTLKTKILQLKKINKKNLFRRQVTLTYKNLDDTHLNFELLSINLFNTNFQILKCSFHEKYSKTFNRFSYQIKV